MNYWVQDSPPASYWYPGEQIQHNSPGNSLYLTARMPGVPIYSLFLLELQGLDQFLLSEYGNQVPVWINLQNTTDVLCLLGVTCVCTRAHKHTHTHTGHVHLCDRMLNIHQVCRLKCSNANYAIYFSLYKVNVTPLVPTLRSSGTNPGKWTCLGMLYPRYSGLSLPFFLLPSSKNPHKTSPKVQLQKQQRICPGSGD